MDTGEVVKITKNVPKPVPVELPKRKSGDISTTPPDRREKETGIPVVIPGTLTPNRKVEVEVDG